MPLAKLSLKYVCVLRKISAFQLCLTSRVTLRQLARDLDPPQCSKCSIHGVPALAMASLLRCDLTRQAQLVGPPPSEPAPALLKTDLKRAGGRGGHSG